MGFESDVAEAQRKCCSRTNYKEQGERGGTKLLMTSIGGKLGIPIAEQREDVEDNTSGREKS